MLLILSVLLIKITVTSSSEYEACGKPADIVFVLDSSASIDGPDFRKMLNFTRAIVNNFAIGQDRTKVGLITFSDTVFPEFLIGEYNNKDDILEAISHVGKENGGTNTADALNFVRTKAFSNIEERPEVPHIVIVITDGQSQNSERTKHESSLAHQEGIVIFAIGIGSQVDEEELSAIASKPVAQYKFEVDTFDALNSIKRELSIKACEVPPATRPPTIEEQIASDSDILFGGIDCAPSIPVALTFAADTADIGITNSKFVLQFIRNIADRLEMDSQKMKLSAITNGCGDNPDTIFDSAYNRDDIDTRLDSIGGPKGIKRLMQKMRLKLTRDNNDMSKVGILFISDRINHTDMREAIRERRRAKFKKIQIFVIGIGGKVQQEQAEALTTARDHYFYTESYETLSQLEGPMLLTLCTMGR